MNGFSCMMLNCNSETAAPVMILLLKHKQNNIIGGLMQVCSKAVEPGNKNRRLNTSLLIRVPRPSGNCNILIDAGK